MRKILLLLFLAFFVIGAVFYFRWKGQEKQARFNVFALAQYIRSLELVEGKKINGLSDIPEAHIVSYGHSLRFRSRYVRQRIFHGYYYDFKRLDAKRFFILASPVRPGRLKREFAMLNDLNMRVNVGKSGKRAYTYDEIKTWPILPVWYDLATVVEK